MPQITKSRWVLPSAFVLFPAVFVKRRVAGVEVFAVQTIGYQTESFAEALVVDDLALA
jgi:hypothetical protein